MAYGKTNLLKSPHCVQFVSQKWKGLVNHPLTFIVLVWLFLFLVFCLVTDFI